MRGRGRRAGLVLATSALAWAAAGRAGETVTYGYDALGRLTATSSQGSVNNGASSAVGYDSAGNRSLYATSVSGAVAFGVSDARSVEGGGLVFTVVKSGTAAAAVDYATANGTAAAGADYSGVSGTLSFAAGESSKILAIPSIDDSTDEPVETVLLNLSGPSVGTLADAQGIGTIVDNDEPPPPPPPPPPSFSVGDASATEGGNLVFTVTKTGPTTSVFSVSYATASGTAYGTYEGGDYYPASGNLFFTAAETSKTVTVHGIDDFLDESNETLSLNLSSPSGGAGLSDAEGTGTILDNDETPPGNLQPTPVDDNVTMRFCSIKSFNVTGNDGDPDGDLPLTVIAVSGNGFSVASSSEVGVDSSQLTGMSGTYTVRDQRGATAAGTLTISLSGGSCTQ